MTSRRSVLSGALGFASAAYAAPQNTEKIAGKNRDGFLDLLRVPDYGAVYSSGELTPLTRAGARWSAPGISVSTQATSSGLPIDLSATGVEPARIHFRWHAEISGDPLLLGDAWERSYGDLGWRSIVPERVMPWYFLAYQDGRVHGYGVKTQASALCFWQLDGQGVSLWLDVSNGGAGVQLGDRELRAAVVVTREGTAGERPTDAAAAFCRRMCEHPRLAGSPLYGSNDWYYAYGKNSAEQTLRDAELMAVLSESNRVRPFTVIDMGWKDGSKTFPSMPELARQIKSRKVHPGLWIRPLEAAKGTQPGLLLPDARFGKLSERAREVAFDPTIPESLHTVTEKARIPAGWGYELIKHDFSTYDLLGKWGREMGPEPTSPGWHLHDRSLTNAEVMLSLYRALRAAAGDHALLIGCNTVGHLGAGIFEAQRIGDDTSGKIWERTRRMGVNTLAYRLPQHDTFFAVDPDCVGVTPEIPWKLNRQWLDLIALTGVPLFVSPDPAAIREDQRAAIKEAFGAVAGEHSRAVPKNWFRDSTPDAWLTLGQDSTQPREKQYRWNAPSGCSPFDV